MLRSDRSVTRFYGPALMVPLLLATACAPEPTVTGPPEIEVPDDPQPPSGRFALTAVNGSHLPFGRAQPSSCGLSVQITSGHLTLDQANGAFRASVITRFPCRVGSVLQEDQAGGTFRLDGDEVVITAEPPSTLAFQSAVWVSARRRALRVEVRHLDGLQTMTFSLP